MSYSIIRQLKEHYKQQLFTLILESDPQPPSDTSQEEPLDWGPSPEEEQQQRQREAEERERQRTQELLRQRQRERGVDGLQQDVVRPEGIEPDDWHKLPPQFPNQGVPPLNIPSGPSRYEDLGNGYGQFYFWRPGDPGQWIPWGSPQLLPTGLPGHLAPNLVPTILPPNGAQGWQWWGNPGPPPVPYYFQDPNGGWYKFNVPGGWQQIPQPTNIPPYVQPQPFPSDGFRNPRYNPPKPPLQTPNPGSLPGGSQPGVEENPQQQPKRRFWQDLFTPSRRQNPGN